VKTARRREGNEQLELIQIYTIERICIRGETKPCDPLEVGVEAGETASRGPALTGDIGGKVELAGGIIAQGTPNLEVEPLVPRHAGHQRPVDFQALLVHDDVGAHPVLGWREPVPLGVDELGSFGKAQPAFRDRVVTETVRF